MFLLETTPDIIFEVTFSFASVFLLQKKGNFSPPLRVDNNLLIQSHLRKQALQS